MIQSMTGYGKSILSLESKKVTLELKSLNSKNLDLNARMPSVYKELELQIRKYLAGALNRGKIDLSIYVESTGAESLSKINKEIVQGYMEQLESFGHKEDLLSIAMRLPDVMKTEREELDPAEGERLMEGLKTTVEELNNFRSSEGKALEKDFLLRVKLIGEHLEKVEAMDADRLEAVKERLQKAISELDQNIDENRFEQELIYYLEKLDITEEKVRLKKYLSFFLEQMEGPVSNGKKLGFIGQEMGREINTIGSKANYAPMQQLVVEMKDELEKIKEQLLNVL